MFLLSLLWSLKLEIGEFDEKSSEKHCFGLSWSSRESCSGDP
jgi:hypothetical protein